MRNPPRCAGVRTLLWFEPGIVAVGRNGDGLIMRRVIAIAVAGASLGGCSSMPSLSWDAFKPTPPAMQVQLEFDPAGADAKTSVGPGCKTPCSVSVPAPDAGFSVTYTLNRFQPATIPVQVIRNPGDFSTPPRRPPIPIRCSRNCSQPVRRRGLPPDPRTSQRSRSRLAVRRPLTRHSRIPVPRLRADHLPRPADCLHRSKPRQVVGRVHHA